MASFPEHIEQLLEAEEYEKIREYAIPLAEAGDADAQFLLGYLYFTSADVDWSEVEPWLRKAADQGHPEAWYHLAHGGNDSSEEPEDGALPYQSLDRRAMLRKAAELGCAEAQRDLGNYLWMGEDESGFAKDYVESRKWYIAAAEQGDVEAQFDLSGMFFDGEGGAIDFPQGLHWLEEAASSDGSEPGAYPAVRILSNIYEHGRYGVTVDIEKAKLLRLRADEIDRAYREENSDMFD